MKKYTDEGLTMTNEELIIDLLKQILSELKTANQTLD
jgi:hypothetical protein